MCCPSYEHWSLRRSTVLMNLTSQEVNCYVSRFGLPGGQLLHKHWPPGRPNPKSAPVSSSGFVLAMWALPGIIEATNINSDSSESTSIVVEVLEAMTLHATTLESLITPSLLNQWALDQVALNGALSSFNFNKCQKIQSNTTQGLCWWWHAREFGQKELKKVWAV